MPLYYFNCNECKKPYKRLVSVEKYEAGVDCNICNTKLIPTPQVPTSTIKEVIDNGIMVKRVEQYANSNELVNERSYQNTIFKNKDEL